MDRYFSSHELFVLLLERNLTATGTIQSNRRDVPFILKTARGRERFSSKFLWDHNNRVVMTSYVPRRGKNVLLMSSSHTSEEISSREDKKPVIIMDYNLGKGGVDVMDSRIEDYSCKRKTSRYPLIFLFNMLDIALLNSFLLMEMTSYSKDRRSFIKAVADQLAKENNLSRFENPSIRAQLQEKFANYGQVQPNWPSVRPLPVLNPRKCQFIKCRKSTRLQYRLYKRTRPYYEVEHWGCTSHITIGGC